MHQNEFYPSINVIRQISLLKNRVSIHCLYSSKTQIQNPKKAVYFKNETLISYLK